MEEIDNQVKESFVSNSDEAIQKFKNYYRMVEKLYNIPRIYTLKPEEQKQLVFLIDSAVETGYSGKFKCDKKEGWDFYQINAHFFPNGTCYLRQYTSKDENDCYRDLVGSYSINNENQFILRICALGECLPEVVELTVGETLEWNNDLLIKY